MSSITLSQDDLKAIRDILNAYTYNNKHRVTQDDLHYIRQLSAHLDKHIIDTPAYRENKVGEVIDSVKRPVRNTELVKSHIDDTPAVMCQSCCDKVEGINHARDYDAELQSVLRQLDELTNTVHKLRYEHRKESATQ